MSYSSILHKPSASSSSHCTSSPLCTSPMNQSTSLALHISCCIETSILMTESGVKKVFLECLVQGMLLARKFARSNFRNSECDVTCSHMCDGPDMWRAWSYGIMVQRSSQHGLINGGVSIPHCGYRMSSKHATHSNACLEPASWNDGQDSNTNTFIGGLCGFIEGSFGFIEGRKMMHRRTLQNSGDCKFNVSTALNTRLTVTKLNQFPMYVSLSVFVRLVFRHAHTQQNYVFRWVW